jgi:hypothetical protein
MSRELIIVTILADSLAMPRPELSYSDLYPYKLSILLGGDFLVVNKARRNNTVVEQASETGPGYLVEEVSYMKESSYFVVHIGIVDCAPRIFSRREHATLERLPAIGKPIINFKSAHRRFFTKHFPKVYVEKDDFRSHLDLLINTIANKTSAEKVFIINIADTNEENKSRSFGFSNNLKEYNSIIADVSKKYNDKVDVFDLYSKTKEIPALVWEDGIHIKKEAHQMIAEYLGKKILEMEGSRKV